MDWGSVAGILLALGGIVLGQKLEGGHLSSLVQPSAFVIVAVGTMGAVLLQCGHATFLRGLRMARRAFVPQRDTNAALVQDLITWSATARREGLLSLEKFVESQPDAFLARGLRMIVDGTDPEMMRQALEMDIDAWESGQKAAAKVWESAGGYSPTIGILGAVLGLIHVMENLSDPGKLGGGIAVAFVATIYGVGLANLFFLPLANKLKSQIAREAFRREVIIDALAGIANGEHPRLIEERLNILVRRA